MSGLIYNYNGYEITFNIGDDDLMVNATEMAKAFNKQPGDWLKTNQAQDYINEFSTVTKIVVTDLITVIKGGNNQGTWMHEQIALEFSRWLSPGFSIWCNSKIKEILTTGTASLKDKPKTTGEMFLQTAQIIVEQERRIEANEQRIKKLEAREITRPEVYAISGYAALQNIKVTLPMAASLGRKATKLCKERGITPGATHDPRFGSVGTYPVEILEEVFETTL